MTNYIFRWLIVFLIFCGSGVFASKVHNPIGVPYFTELYIVMLLVFSFFYFAHGIVRRELFFVFDLILLVTVFSAMLLSAFFAYAYHGQPLIFGLIEDRRLLMCFVYFPIVFALKKNLLSFDEFMRVVFFSGAFCCALLLAVNILHFGASSIGDLNREERMGIGVLYIVLSIAVSLAKVTSKVHRLARVERASYYLYLAVSMLVLLIISQGRQIIIGLALVGGCYVMLKKFRVFFSIFGGSVFVISVLGVGGDIYSSFLELVSDDYLTHSARVRTIAVIFEELYGNDFLGMGALSNLWNGGFSNIYHDYFFLSDVGFFGTIYRYGFMAPLLYAPIVYKLVQSAYVLRSSQIQFFILFMTAFMFVLSPFGAMLESRGSVTGLVLALAVSAIADQKKHRGRGAAS